ncbi:MAG: zinc-ribbon domain-containing protein [Xanthomonadales bacterium]|nr:zinc-ribbon domain-containing protein [Xanthomonadales bacterium]
MKDQSCCKNCGAVLREHAKFCTNCGKPILHDSAQVKTINFQDQNPGNNSKKSLAPIVWVVIALLFAGYFVTNYFFDETKEDSLVHKIEAPELQGQWYDFTGVLLGDKTASIEFTNQGDIFIGQSSNDRINIELIPTKKHEFNANVTLHGVKGEFYVIYYHDKKTLEFHNILTKSTWKITKN